MPPYGNEGLLVEKVSESSFDSQKHLLEVIVSRSWDR